MAENSEDTKTWISRGILTVLISLTLVGTIQTVSLLKSIVPLVKEHSRQINNNTTRLDYLYLDVNKYKESQAEAQTKIWERLSYEGKVAPVPGN